MKYALQVQRGASWRLSYRRATNELQENRRFDDPASSPDVPTLRFFFFQAEDGIRDGRVTGVQTYALPISAGDVAGETDRESVRVRRRHGELPVRQRSEERRVGKECRSRWSRDR